MILQNNVPQLLSTLGNDIFFTYYSSSGKNYIPGRVIYERIIDWDLHTINNKKTLSRIKIIFNWYIESQKPVNFKSGELVIDNQKYKDYIDCDIKYIYISFRKLKNNKITNPFEIGSYDELAVIKIDSLKIPIYKHTSDLTTPVKGYGNGYLTMITGGRKENTTFWTTEKVNPSKEFITNDKITNIDWKSSNWEHDESNTGYYFTIINNKSPLIKTNIPDNDGYYDFKIVSPNSSTWEPKDIENINIFDKSVWWRDKGVEYTDTPLSIFYSQGSGYDSEYGSYTYPDPVLIKNEPKFEGFIAGYKTAIGKADETKYGKDYSKTLKWNQSIDSGNSNFILATSSINITETANYNINCSLNIITYLKKYTSNDLYLFPQGQTTSDDEAKTGLGGNSGILYWVEIQKRESNNNWTTVNKSSEFGIYASFKPVRKILALLTTYDVDYTFLFSDINLLKGEYQMVLKWKRNQKYLFGVQPNPNLEWEYASNDWGNISYNNQDTLGNNNFYASINQSPEVLNANSLNIVKVRKDGDVYDKMINKFRPKIHLKNDQFKYPSPSDDAVTLFKNTSDIKIVYSPKLYSNNYSYLILINTFAKYYTDNNKKMIDLPVEATRYGEIDGLGPIYNSSAYYVKVGGNNILNLFSKKRPSYVANTNFYKYNFDNILEDMNDTPFFRKSESEGNSNYWSKFSSIKNNLKDSSDKLLSVNFNDELNFIHTFDINDAYINESFFKTYGIITKSFFLDEKNNFDFKKDEKNKSELDLVNLSDFDISILIGKHFAVFKCNVLMMENDYPTILPHNATTKLPQADILNAGKIIFKPNKDDDIIFVNQTTSGYNIEYDKEYYFDKIKKFPMFFKIWLNHCNYLNFSILNETDPKTGNFTLNGGLGYDKRDGLLVLNHFNILAVVDKNLEPLKGTGFPDKVYIEIKEKNESKFFEISEDTKLTNKYTINKSIIINISNKFTIVDSSLLDKFLTDRWVIEKKNITLKYYLILDTDSDERIYSKATWPFYTKIKSDATEYDILVEYNKTWTDPSISNSGSWYQLYDSWEFKGDGLNVRLATASTVNPTITKGYYPYNQSITYKITETNWGSSTLPLFPLHYYFNNTFNKNQIYQFRLIINNYTQTGQSKLILITPWFDYFEFNNLISTNKLIPTNFYFYSKIEDLDKNLAKTTEFLSSKTNYTFTKGDIKDFEYFKSTTNPKNPITILGNTNFGKNGQSLKGLLISKSWFIQGYAMFNSYVNNDTTGLTINYDSTSVGWHFINNPEFTKYKYIWYDKKPNTSNYPIGYKINSENIFDSVLDASDIIYISNNFICRYIESNTFNLSFRYDNKIRNLTTIDVAFSDNQIVGLNFYIGSKLPKDKGDLNLCISNGTIKLIASLKDSKYYEFLSLSGNNYLFFIAEPATIDKTAVLSTISDIEIVTTYHELNNDIVSLENDIVTSTDLIYKSKVGIGDNFSNNSIIDYKIVNSKIGNGSFESGTWKNGTWNNGWRTSKNYNFLDVLEFYNLNERWSFTIYGSTYSTSNFEVGDKVSISNIVAIDINNDRRLLKNSFTIIYKSDNTITLELFYDFPIRSIEKDSRNHLISVSKNIWLNGLFLNGTFNGNWIDGVFNGYPFITKIANSHWVDGKFDGGHFKSNTISFTASLTIPAMDSLDIYWSIKVENEEGHNLESGDNFNITLDDQLVDLNVTSDQLVDLNVTDILNSNKFNCNLLKNFGTSSITEIVKTIEIVTKKKTSLIQNFNFIDNNISDRVISDIKLSSNLKSNYLFLYNSWMDLVYEQNSATNIFKPQTLIDNDDNFYSENNLHGYITSDVLSSNSMFRDSFSKRVREYKLGVKWKVYHDYIGDSSFFDDYLHSIYTPKKVTDLGWKWNVSSTTLNNGTSSFVLYRSDEKNDKITGKELVLSAIGDGGTLNIQNDNLFTTTKIPNRYNEGIKPLGYSMISFDLIDKIVDGLTFSGDYIKYKVKNRSLGTVSSTSSSISNNSLNFSNINETIINLDGKTQSIAMSYLPVYENINHLKINSINKVEYFFNKRDLMMKLSGQGKYGSDKIQIILDNLKFYELDMIPFFQYLKEENVNNSIQIPNGIYYKSYNKIYDKNLSEIKYKLINNIENITIGSDIGPDIDFGNWTTFYTNFKNIFSE